MIQKLIKFIQLANRVVPKKTTIPILSSVCVEDGFIRATDLETTIRMPVEDKRRYTLPLGVLKSVAKSKPKSFDIDLLINKKIKITYDNRKLLIQSLDPNDFPSMLKESFRSIGSWSKKTLQSLGSMLPFASKEEFKPALKGIYVILGEDITFVATDGHLLREARINNPTPGEKLNFRGIIPAAPLEVIAKHALSSTDVAYSKSFVKFTLLSEIEIFIKLIDEKYPPYEEFVSAKKRSSVEFSKKDMISVITDAKEFSDNTTLRAELVASNGSIEIITADHEKDIHFESRVKAENRKGKCEKTGFNLKYLEKVLRSIKGEKVRWEYGKPIEASYFRGLTKEDEGVTNLLMPIRLEDK